VSGIVGFVCLDGRDADPALLETLMQGNAFRGPDGAGTVIRSAMGFGHTLFRTVEDTDADAQPCTLDGAAWITADARIDDRPTLISALGAHGAHVAAGVTDAQLILHAYHAWGTSCTDRLLGDFAFAIWDPARQVCFAARDHFGVRPFFYALVGGAFVFANTLDVVRRHPQVSDAIDEQAIGDFLLIGSNGEPSTTAYRDIRRVPAAHQLLLNCVTGTATCTRFWRLPDPAPIWYRRDEEYVEHFDHLLRQAVADRLRLSRAAIFVSGGIDSTSLAATVRSVRSAAGAPFGLTGVTCADRSDRASATELSFATIAAECLGMPLEVVSAPAAHSWHPQPEPVDDPDAALRAALFARAAVGARVAFNGEDGDALLEPASPREQFRQFRQFGTGTVLRSMAAYLLRQRRLPYLGLHLRDAFGRPGRTELPAWLAEDFVTRADLKNRADELDRQAREYQHPTRSLACQSYTSKAWPPFLDSLDAGLTGLPLEVRLPLIDVRLIRFVFAIPSTPWCERKELLRRTMRGRLPDALLDRPKHTGVAPSLEFASAADGTEAWTPLAELDSFVKPQIGCKSHRHGQDAQVAARPRLLDEWLRRRRLSSPVSRSIV